VTGRIVRSRTAERTAELLGSREGRKHLSQHGWTQGMPVVMAGAQELLDDVMGLVSVHGRAALIAMIDPRSDDLQFLHVSAPSPVLEIVTPAAARTRIASLFAAAEDEGMQTFRVKYWQHSAVAHLIPACHRSAEEDRLSYRPKLSS